MNVFVVQLSPRGDADERRPARALAELLGETPFFDGAAHAAWRAPSGRCALASAAHDPAQTGGIRHVAAEPLRVATFAGRPFLWLDEFEADGRAPLDPGFYLAPAAAWIDRLDGRWAAVRYDDEEGELEVCSDPLGSYPLYVAADDGELWISNSAELVRRLAGADASRPSALASFLACGAVIDGVPRWDGVDRLPAGLQRFRARDGTRRGPDAIDWPSLLDETFDAEVASRRLVAVVRALADWPGRPVFTSLSGGRDSRVVFAAALAAGVDVRPRTMSIPGSPGYPEPADVVLARALCARAGLEHELIEPDVTVPPAELAPLLGRLSAGGISLELAAQGAFARPVPQPSEPLELVATGHCGEVARAYYGVVDETGGADGVAERLLARTMPGLPRPLLAADGRELYREAIHGWAARQAQSGVAPSLLLDLFYLDQRMPHWIAVSQGVSEVVHDLVNPLWSRRLLPQEVGLAPDERRAERFHLDVIAALAPGLLEVPFDIEAFRRSARRGGGMSAGRARTVAKLRRELRRSIRGFAGRDLLPDVTAALRQAVASDGTHAAWEVLDRRRVHRLLARDPHRLDRRSRSLIWRLATVLLVPDGVAAAGVEPAQAAASAP